MCNYQFAAMIIRMNTHNLSKSRFMAGLQCPKRLWLQTHRKDLSEGFVENMAIINGNEVGEVARAIYPGVLIGYEQGLSAAIEETTRLINNLNIDVIHEATLQHGGVLVRVDVLTRVGDQWILGEVKGATSVKEYYLDDVTIQAWVLQGYGLKLQAVELIHVDNSFVYQGDNKYDGLLNQVDVSSEVEKRISDIPGKLNEFMKLLSEDEPEIEMGPQCNSPYTCEYCDYCAPPGASEYPLSVLPGLRENKLNELSAAGYEDIREIPDGVLTNEKMERVRRATIAGEAEYDSAASSILDDLAFPRYFLDFETISFAVPKWKGMRPYQIAPFQWSCHIQYEDGSMEHVEFLDLSGNDPRRSCAERLVQDCGTEGTIIAYNASFEKSVIKMLAANNCDLEEKLLALNERFFDLLPLTRNYYYHPSQKGSWSIKNVLPALVPELSYADLDEVQNGEGAQIAYMQAVLNPSDREKSDRQLREYCKLDTLAMVKIAEELVRMGQ